MNLARAKFLFFPEETQDESLQVVPGFGRVIFRHGDGWRWKRLVLDGRFLRALFRPHFAEAQASFGMAMRCGLLQPFRGEQLIRCDPTAETIGKTQREFGVGVALGRRLLEPRERGGGIRGRPMAVEVTDRQAEFRRGKALSRRAAETQERLAELMLPEVHHTQIREPAHIHRPAHLPGGGRIWRQRHHDRPGLQGHRFWRSNLWDWLGVQSR